MLNPISREESTPYMDFSAIAGGSQGSGRCFVYNAVVKKTKAGKPFVTLYLRDVRGRSVPGYIFDIKSPLMAGKEMVEIINSVVEIEWQENYLRGVGMTLILDKVSKVKTPTSADLEKFCGIIPDLQQKRKEIEQFITGVVGISVALPMTIERYSSSEYHQGKVGGLCQHYWEMMRIIRSFDWRDKLEYERLVAVFAIFIITHSSYVRASDEGNDGIDLVVRLTNIVSSVAQTLKVGDGALELVNMFFGYEPKDVYVRSVQSASDFAHRVDKEFSVYSTIPLKQEGDAGYGKIRRYSIEAQGEK